MPRPHREKILKQGCRVSVNLTQSQYELVSQQAKESNISMSEYILKVLTKAKVHIHYDLGGIRMEQLENLIAEYGKIGSNLNQIARHLNSGGAATPDIITDVRTAILDLDDLKYDILKIVGEAYGNH